MPTAYTVTAMLALLAVLGSIEVAGPRGVTVATLTGPGEITSVGPWAVDVRGGAFVRAVTISRVEPHPTPGKPHKYLIRSYYCESDNGGRDKVVRSRQLENTSSDYIQGSA